MTTRTETEVSIWVGNGDASAGADAVADAALAVGAGSASMLRWMGDRLLYVARAGATQGISSFVLGQTSEEIVANADSPGATSDGRIIYVSRETTTMGTLWKADAGGRRPVQLARDSPVWPTVTRDNRHVVYVSTAQTGRLTPWMVPLDGGMPTQIADVDARVPDLSPDGRALAFITSGEPSRTTVLICDLPACNSQRRLLLQGRVTQVVRWTPDGRGIAYVNEQPQPNLWIRPLDGSPARQLSRFTDGRAIPDFTWSSDGEHLAIARVTTTTDLVLFRGLRRNASR